MGFTFGPFLLGPAHLGLEISNRTRQTSRPSLEGTPFPVPNGTRRFYRSGPASSPLLQRAGLGPDVVRAFSLEQESGHQLLGNASTGRQSDISPAKKIIGHEDLTKSNRNRINSTTTSDGMQPDDLDSGFGPSGGGGSQKFYGLDKFSDAWKVSQTQLILHFNLKSVMIFKMNMVQQHTL